MVKLHSLAATQPALAWGVVTIAGTKRRTYPEATAAGLVLSPASNAACPD